MQALVALVAALGLVACTTVATPMAPEPAVPAGSAVLARFAVPAGSAPPAELPGLALAATAGPRVARLVAVSGEPREVPLRWQPVFRGDVLGYRIYRRPVETPGEAAPAYVAIARVDGIAATTFVDRGGVEPDEPGRLQDAHTYVYAVAAFGDRWTGERSEPVAATTAAPPPPPDGLDNLPPRAGEVLLVWEPSADRRVGGYRVYRSAFPAGPFEMIGQTADRFATAFADPARAGLQRLRSYFYRVSAVSVAGAEGPLSEATPARLKSPPLPPLDVTAVGGLARHVRLRWSVGPESDLTTVVVWRALGDGAFRRVAETRAERTEYTDGGLGDGVTVRYRLTVVDADGLESEPSSPAVATTRARPPAPRDVTVQRDGPGVLVRWRAAPPTAGVSRYRVLRIGWLGAAEPLVEVSGTLARDSKPAPRYAVVAIDVEGLESLPAEATDARGP